MSYKGKMIEYVEHGKFLCGLVMEDTGKRLRLVNQNGREGALPPSRIVHLANSQDVSFASREDIIKELKQVAERRQSLKDSIDLEQIWELANEENETGISRPEGRKQWPDRAPYEQENRCGRTDPGYVVLTLTVHWPMSPNGR